MSDQYTTGGASPPTSTRSEEGQQQQGGLVHLEGFGDVSPAVYDILTRFVKTSPSSSSRQAPRKDHAVETQLPLRSTADDVVLDASRRLLSSPPSSYLSAIHHGDDDSHAIRRPTSSDWIRAAPLPTTTTTAIDLSDIIVNGGLDEKDEAYYHGTDAFRISPPRRLSSRDDRGDGAPFVAGRGGGAHHTATLADDDLPDLLLASAGVEAEDPMWGNIALEVEARLCHKSALLTRCLSRWRDKADARSSNKRSMLLTAAGFHERMVCFGAFRRWQHRFHDRWSSAQQRELADRNYALNLVAKPFTAWRRLAVDVRRHQRERLADIYHEAACAGAARHWNAWLAFWHRRVMARQLEQLSRYRLAKRWYNVWRRYATATAVRGYVIGVFEHKRRYQTAFSALWKWRVSTCVRVMARRREIEARLAAMATSAAVGRMRGVFTVWAAAARASINGRLCATLQDWTRVAAIASVWRRWTQWQSLNASADSMVMAASAKALRRCFTLWRRRQEEGVMERQRDAIAVRFCDVLSYSKRVARPFKAWRLLCTSRKTLRREGEEALALRSALLGGVGVSTLKTFAQGFILGVGSSPSPTQHTPSPLYSSRQPTNPFLSVRTNADQFVNTLRSGGGGGGVAAAPKEKVRQDSFFSAPTTTATVEGSTSRPATEFDAVMKRQRSPLPLTKGLRNHSSPSSSHSHAYLPPAPLPPVTSAAVNRFHSSPSPSSVSPPPSSMPQYPPEVRASVAALKERVAVYTMMRQEEPLLAAELHRLTEACRWLHAVGGEEGEQVGSEGRDASLRQMEAQIASIRARQRVLSNLREEIAAIRSTIGSALLPSRQQSGGYPPSSPIKR